MTPNAEYEALIAEARMGQDGCEDCVLLQMLADALEGDHMTPNAEPRPDDELYDGTPVHTESYRRGFHNGYQIGYRQGRDDEADNAPLR